MGSATSQLWRWEAVAESRFTPEEGSEGESLSSLFFSHPSRTGDSTFPRGK